MKTIWLDVTTTLKWNRPPVGILRVERELIGYHLTQGTHCRFVKFDQTTKAFVEVFSDEIQKVFSKHESQGPQIKSAKEPVYKMHEKKHFTKKEKVVREIFRILNKMNLILNILGLKKENQKQNTAPSEFPTLRKIQVQESQKIDNEPPPCCFKINDAYISCGLDWDDKDLNFLYRLKNELGLRVTLFCYDLIPIKYPHLVLLHVGSKFQEYFYHLAWCADSVCCISKNSEDDLKEQCQKLGAPIPPTTVIRLGDNIFKEKWKGSEEPVKLKDKKFILFVSTVEKRKNHITILHAFTRLYEKHGDSMPYLVFVGMPGWGVTELVQDLELDPRIQNRFCWFQNLPDQELQWLYHNCLFTVFPSLYEGWGLPVAESLAAGKYCLISDSSSLREVAPQILQPLDPLDVPSWVKIMEYLILNPMELEKKEQNIRNNYCIQNWKDAFKKLSIYNK